MSGVAKGGSCKHLPQARLIAWLDQADSIVASAAKLTISPKDFTEILESLSSDKKDSWIRELVSRGHGSPLEHSIYVFEVVCSRACSHQLVRHRHASYSQLSQRYSDKFLRKLVEKTSALVNSLVPEGFADTARVLEEAENSLKDFNTLLDVVSEAYVIPPAIVEIRDAWFLKQLLKATATYYRALASQVPYEDARYLLPQAVKTRVLVSMNARELLEVFLPLRMCSRAQWEIRMVAWELRNQLVKTHPAIFSYAGPRCVLLENRVRSNPCSLNDYLEGRCSFTIQRCPEHVPNNKIPSCLRSASINSPS
uniref:Flavin-dependent thymidylate synthase n=1 Tax=Thermosphaera aggregans TaxID=54254 RepID=A0A7C2FXS2_9CREN